MAITDELLRLVGLDNPRYANCDAMPAGFGACQPAGLSSSAFSFMIQFVNNPAPALGETIRKPVAVVGDEFTQAPGGAASPGPVRVAE